MTNKIVFFLFFLCYLQTFSQVEGNLLLGLNELTTAEMNLINNPIKGSLIYNTTEDSTFQYNGVSWRKLAPSLPTVIEKTTNYVATPSDNGSVLTFNSTSDVRLILNSSLPIGFNISLYQIGEGNVFIVNDTGVTLKNRLSRFVTAGKNSGVGIICTSNSVFHITGDLKQ